MPFIVALTGGIGSGKSSAAAYFANLGIAVVDTDAIAHDLTRPDSPAVREIARRFGGEYLLADGSLDRAKLRQLVFNTPSARTELECLLHPLILQEAERRIRAADTPYVVVVVPLLFERGDAYRKMAQRIVTVDCDPSRQISRTQARSGLTADEVRAIMATQAEREGRLKQSDIVLSNNGAPDELHAQVAALHLRLLKEAACHASAAVSVCQKPRIVSE